MEHFHNFSFCSYRQIHHKRDIDPMILYPFKQLNNVGEKIEIDSLLQPINVPILKKSQISNIMHSFDTTDIIDTMDKIDDIDTNDEQIGYIFQLMQDMKNQNVVFDLQLEGLGYDWDKFIFAKL